MEGKVVEAKTMATMSGEGFNLEECKVHPDTLTILVRTSKISERTSRTSLKTSETSASEDLDAIRKIRPSSEERTYRNEGM